MRRETLHITKRYACSLVICLIVMMSNMMLASTPSHAQESSYKIKAVFLFKFFKYITWPQNTENGKKICVLGENPFGEALEYIAKNKFAASAFSTAYLTSTDTLSTCHLVFISQSEKNRVNEILEKIAQHKGILSVSDIKDFAHSGGGIEFAQDRSKTKILLNSSSFEKRQLSANSKLMKIATVIQ